MAKEELKVKEEVKEAKKKFELTEIPTQTMPVIKDDDGNIYNELTILCKLANDIHELKRSLI